MNGKNRFCRFRHDLQQEPRDPMSARQAPHVGESRNGLAAAKARGRVGGRPVIRSRPAAKSRWLDACLLTRATLDQKSVQPSGSLVRHCIGTSKRRNQQSNYQKPPASSQILHVGRDSTFFSLPYCTRLSVFCHILQGPFTQKGGFHGSRHPHG